MVSTSRNPRRAPASSPSPLNGVRGETGFSARLPDKLIHATRRHQLLPSRFILTINVAAQSMRLFQKAKDQPPHARFPQYTLRKDYIISTSSHGLGQVMGSNQT